MPALFEELGESVLEREDTRLPVKQAGLVLSDPTQTAPENWMASCVITRHLVAALRYQVEFRTENHSVYLWEGRTVVWRWFQQRAEETLASKMEGGPFQGAR